MPRWIIELIGATDPLRLVDLELADGRKVKATLHSAEVEIDGRKGLVKVASFENAKPAIGMDTLMALDFGSEGRGMRFGLVDRVLLRTAYLIGSILMVVLKAIGVLLIIALFALPVIFLLLLLLSVI